MLNIATMGILKGNANPETPGGEKRPHLTSIVCEYDGVDLDLVYRK